MVLKCAQILLDIKSIYAVYGIIGLKVTNEVYLCVIGGEKTRLRDTTA